jgi:hypothetical protein
MQVSTAYVPAHSATSVDPVQTFVTSSGHRGEVRELQARHRELARSREPSSTSRRAPKV